MLFFQSINVALTSICLLLLTAVLPIQGAEPSAQSLNAIVIGAPMTAIGLLFFGLLCYYKKTTANLSANNHPLTLYSITAGATMFTGAGALFLLAGSFWFNNN